MLLRFNDVPRDATNLDETGFLDRKDAPRVGVDAPRGVA